MPSQRGETLLIDSAVLPPEDRVEAIRHAIWELVVRVEIEQPPPPTVAARCRLRQWGAITQCSVQANAHTIRRTPRLARDEMEPSLFLGLQVTGTSMVVQDGREAVLRPGDLAFYDTTRPYTLLNDGGIDQHYFRIPRSALALPARAVDAATATTLSASHPLVDVASAYFARLALQPDIVPEARAAVSVPSVELVRALIATRSGSARLVRETLSTTLVDRALEYARLHLTEPNLTPARIAAAQHVSVRHLYAAMAAAEISLAGWIRTQRLEACRLELTHPASRLLTVAAVAARWGFVDPTHFSRAFRAEFGVSPREWRRLHVAG
ncbi:AraC-type DNA-binding protein [Friedmanniella luteola]|uniref:AraC-type DNA-binding protein n=1 Tax=Friedmanniella luteola TaxID=546871 RepID=A0A1H1SZN2_9ACTN|nr:helix-turn-helix domain-containing protein [Friedmanniella luteola]SDS53364.1 AraC-type DNA-binding protein [Friedmanniella luteola]